MPVEGVIVAALIIGISSFYNVFYVCCSEIRMNVAVEVTSFPGSIVLDQLIHDTYVSKRRQLILITNTCTEENLQCHQSSRCSEQSQRPTVWLM